MRCQVTWGAARQVTSPTVTLKHPNRSINSSSRILCRRRVAVANATQLLPHPVCWKGRRQEPGCGVDKLPGVLIRQHNSLLSICIYITIPLHHVNALVEGSEPAKQVEAGLGPQIIALGLPVVVFYSWFRR